MVDAPDVAALDACEGRLAVLERSRSALHAAMLREALVLDRLWTAAEMAVSSVSDLALALGCSEYRAYQLAGQGRLLASLPGAFDALSGGLLTVEQTQTLLGQLEPLGPAVRLAVWQASLPRLRVSADGGGPLPPARLSELLRRLVARVDPGGVARRRRVAQAAASVDYRRRDDGLVDLFALGITGPNAQACLASIAAREDRSGRRTSGRPGSAASTRWSTCCAAVTCSPGSAAAAPAGRVAARPGRGCRAARRCTSTSSSARPSGSPTNPPSSSGTARPSTPSSSPSCCSPPHSYAPSGSTSTAPRWPCPTTPTPRPGTTPATSDARCSTSPPNRRHHQRSGTPDTPTTSIAPLAVLPVLPVLAILAAPSPGLLPVLSPATPPDLSPVLPPDLRPVLPPDLRPVLPPEQGPALAPVPGQGRLLPVLRPESWWTPARARQRRRPPGRKIRSCAPSPVSAAGRTRPVGPVATGSRAGSAGC